MPFGLRNAAQTFQTFIDHVFRGLPFVYAYIYDLLVANRNEKEHKEHLALVFDRLDKFGVFINPSKCVLRVPSLEFLSNQVDSEGLRPLPSKVAAIRDVPPPLSKRQSQRLPNMVNFYRQSLLNCTDLMLPLTNILSGPKGPLELIGEALTAFEGIKNSLADLTSLTNPAPEAQLSQMAETIAKAFANRWVAMFSTPSTVTSGRGVRFEYALFQTLINFLGCTPIRTTASHPAAYGMVERFHRQPNTALRAIEDPGNWSDNLRLALLGIPAALKSDLDCGAAELVFSTTLRLPGEMVTPKLPWGQRDS
nr:unnamed protein product [Spirometra erinaceieuropaei]